MLEAQKQAEQLLTKEYLQTQHAQVTMKKETIERRQMLVSSEYTSLWLAFIKLFY